MKKLLLSVALLGLTALASANSTLLGYPGNAGRPQADTQTNGSVYQQMPRGFGDCSLGSAFSSVLSSTSQVVSVTGTAGLSWSASSYAGPITMYFVNTGASTLVVYGSLTPTALSSVTNANAGLAILAGQSGSFSFQSRANMTVHVQGLTATTSCNVSACSY